MGYLHELNTLVTALGSSTFDKNRLPQQSMAKGALDGTLQFPCLISDSISANMAATIVKALEPVYASFVQTVISINSTIDISVDKGPREFLRRFHKNITSFESTMNDEDFEIAQGFMEKVADGTYKVFVNEAQDTAVFFNVVDKGTRTMLESHKELLESVLDYIDVSPIINIGNSVYYESDGIPTKSDLMDSMMKQTSAKSLRDMTTTKSPAGVQVLKTMDVKKLNELQPYAMQVRLMAVNGEKEFVQFMDFVMGVKVILHSIRSEEIIYNTKAAIENTGKFFNFLKWTTGEKSLFKDLILNLNNVKLDVANKSRGASPWWLTLKRLKETSKLQEVFFARNQIVPNSTLVIGSFEVDQIESNFGYNLNDPRIAKKLMGSLFLMNFIIIDDASQFVRILYDGQSDYQSFSLDAFEREVQTASSKLSKELVRMVSR